MPPASRTNRTDSCDGDTSTLANPHVAFWLLPSYVWKYGACATVGLSAFMFLPPAPTVDTTVPLPLV